LQGRFSNWGAQAVILFEAYSGLFVQFLVKRRPFPVVLCHFRGPTGPEELQQIARRAHQLPLVANILFATQAEAAKIASSAVPANNHAVKAATARTDSDIRRKNSFPYISL
jgi:hypothetical protein